MDRRAVFILVLGEVFCFGGLERDTAAFVIGLGKPEIPVRAGNDNRLAYAGRSGKPGGRGGVAPLDAEVHKEEALLHDQETGENRQQAYELAPFDLDLLL